MPGWLRSTLSSEDEFQDSKEGPPPRSLAESITATRVPQVATSQTSQLQPNLTKHHVKPTGLVESPQTPSSLESANTQHTANLLEDIKYFHNAALSYQDAYEALQLQQAELQTKFTEQAQLVQEASETIKAVEAESNARQQEIAALREQREADIQQAVGQAMVQYQDQLSSAQANLQQRDREHQQSIQRLQESGPCTRVISSWSGNLAFCCWHLAIGPGYARRFLISFLVQ